MSKNPFILAGIIAIGVAGGFIVARRITQNGGIDLLNILGGVPNRIVPAARGTIPSPSTLVTTRNVPVPLGYGYSGQ